MEISDDYFNINVLPQGVSYSEAVRDSSETYINKLLENGLIIIDSSNKLLLTDRGRVAVKIGLKKYLEIEKFETKLRNDHTKEVKANNYIQMVIIISLVICTSFILVYVCWLVDYQ